MKIPAWAIGLEIRRVESGLVELGYESPNLALQRVGSRMRGVTSHPDVVHINLECNDKTDLVYVRAHLIVRGESEEKVEADVRLRRRIGDQELPGIIADLTRRLMIACGESL